MGVFENTLDTTAKIVVYTPLVLLSLFIIINFIKNVRKWLNNPDKSWKNEPTGIVFIIMTCVGFFLGTLKLLFNILKKIYSVLSKKITLSVGLLSLVVFLTLSYYYFIKGPYISLVKYSNIINLILLFGGILIFFYLFFIKKDKIYNEENDFTDKNNWKNISKGIFRKSSKYLFLLICLGMSLALLAGLCYIIFSFNFVSITSLWLVTVLLSVGIMFILYTQLKKIPIIKKLLSNKLFSLLYHFVFILPCLFLETAKFIHTEVKNTPNIVYKVLLGEIVFISLFIIVPMVSKILYTTAPKDPNKSSIISKNLEVTNNDINHIDKEISKWKGYTPLVIDDNGNQKDITTYSLSDETWDYIIKNNLNNKNNEESLKNELLNNGYNKNNGIFDLIKYVQKNTSKILQLLGRKKDLILKRDEISKENENVSSFEKGKLLINKPHHLSIKRYTDDNKNDMDYQNLNSTNYAGDYNYNYSLSCWIFLHSTSNYKDEYKSIINYNGKPNIMYNFYKNTLEIRMGNENKKIIYKKKNFKLQKWHNIVVNYVGGTFDIFINNKLVATYSNVVPYMNYDKISVGDVEGVNGGICNVVYFPSYISKTRIESNYLLFKNRNPPI